MVFAPPGVQIGLFNRDELIRTGKEELFLSSLFPSSHESERFSPPPLKVRASRRFAKKKNRKEKKGL